jgi:streptogramin lyase
MGGTLGRSLFQLAGVAHAVTDAEVHLTLNTAKLTVTVTDPTGTALQGVSVEVVGTLIVTTGAGSAVLAIARKYHYSQIVANGLKGEAIRSILSTSQGSIMEIPGKMTRYENQNGNSGP